MSETHCSQCGKVLRGAIYGEPGSYRTLCIDCLKGTAWDPTDPRSDTPFQEPPHPELAPDFREPDGPACEEQSVMARFLAACEGTDPDVTALEWLSAHLTAIREENYPATTEDPLAAWAAIQAMEKLLADLSRIAVVEEFDAPGEGRANARLIAAAPALLKACRAAWEWLDANAGSLPPHGEMEAELLAAMDLVEGRVYNPGDGTSFEGGEETR